LTDIIIEVIRTIIVGGIVIFLLFNSNFKHINKIKGWKLFVAGFCLVFFGMLIDITDNFENLNRFIIIGDTLYQAVIEKIIGYLLGFILIAFGVFLWIPRMIELANRRKYELEKATTKVKILSGFLPICASCKQIRDDEGYWNQIESYIRDHSEAEFSHGICPECVKKLYPELYDREIK
jgi:hypothetical protein